MNEDPPQGQLCGDRAHSAAKHSSSVAGRGSSLFGLAAVSTCCLGSAPGRVPGPCALGPQPTWARRRQLLLGREVQIFSLLGSPGPLGAFSLSAPTPILLSSRIFPGIAIGSRVKESWCSLSSGSWQLQSPLLSPRCSCPGSRSLEAQGEQNTL